MTMKDRVKELRRVPASELRANPKNWRRHPPSQEAALRGILEDIGFADAVIARETDDGLELIDGHLRQEVMGDQEIPVLVVDLTDDEATKMLITLDPLAALAETDEDNLRALMELAQFEDDRLTALLSGLLWNAEEVPFPQLSSEDRSPIRQMTFTITEAQRQGIEDALAAAKQTPFGVTGNENSNGNALARIAGAYVGG